MIKTRTLRVAGVTFRDNYPDNLRQLDMLLDGIEEGEEYFPAHLERDPSNEHDPNAIRVIVPALQAYFDAWVGFIPRDEAERWAPLMDAGAVMKAYVKGVKVSSENPDKPGLEIIVVNPRVASTVEEEGVSAVYKDEVRAATSLLARRPIAPPNFWKQAAKDAMDR